MKKFLAVLAVLTFGVFLVAGPAIADNIRPIAGTSAGDFSTLQTNFTSLGLGFDAFNDQQSAAYFLPTGQGSTATYLFSETYDVYVGDYEIGVYDPVSGTDLKLWDEATGISAGQSVAVVWDQFGVASSSFFNGTSWVTIDVQAGFGPVFGIYLNSYYGIQYSDDALNNGRAQILAFNGNINNVDPNYWYFGIEGADNDGSYPYSSGNIDFNDFIIKVESIKPVPEPATLLLLGLGLLGLGITRRK